MAFRFSLPPRSDAALEGGLIFRRFTRCVPGVGGCCEFRILRRVIGAILLFAAINKFYALAVSDTLPDALFRLPSWALYASVVVEGVLGIWLLIGGFAYAAWGCSVICFSVFLCIALNAALSGAEACACFGFLSTSPWLTVLMDASILGGLLVFKPTSQVAIQSRSALHAASLLSVFVIASIYFVSGIRAQLESVRSTNGSKSSAVGPSINLQNRAIILGAAGIPPASIALQDLSLEQLIDASTSLHELGGSTFESVTPDQALETFAINDLRAAPIVLEDKQRRVTLALGMLSDAGESYYQLLSSNGPPFLLRSSELHPSAIDSAWRVNSKGDGVNVTFGRARLNVDKLYANFGIVRPASTNHTEFVLSNRGDYDILISDRPRTTCGCSVADIGATSRLKPGESLPLKVSLTAGKHSIRQSVRVELQDSDSGERFPLEMQLLACQLESMAIVPGGLDFGQVSHRDRVARTLRLSEVSSDRFKPTSVDVGSLPLTYELSGKENADGLHDYYVRFELSTNGLEPGEYKQTVAINTNSRQLPEIKVPVRFRVQPQYDVQSKIVSFGAIPIDSQLEKIITLRAPELSEHGAIRFGHIPESVSASTLSSEGGDPQDPSAAGRE